MSAVILDFLEYKFNHRLVTITVAECILFEDLDMELAEALKTDYENFFTDPTDA